MHKYAEIVGKFPQVKALVVGDSMRDLYHFGHVDRLSPEAPVPVFIEDRQKGRPGGAANVASNLVALGCQVESVFPISGKTTEKHRYMVGHQQLFRIDRDILSTPELKDISAAVTLSDWADVVVLSDYAKGWLTPEMCQHIIAAGKPVVVDPKGAQWAKYAGATVICPNEREYLNWARDYFPPSIVLKRGEDGIDLIECGRDWRNYPAQGRQVFDVTGAGDTVVAVVAAMVGAGEELADACVVANAAAGVVVGKIGTSECSAQELLCALDSATAASTASTPDTDSSSSKPESIATGSSLPSTQMSPCGVSKGTIDLLCASRIE